MLNPKTVQLLYERVENEGKQEKQGRDQKDEERLSAKVVNGLVGFSISESSSVYKT